MAEKIVITSNEKEISKKFADKIKEELQEIGILAEIDAENEDAELLIFTNGIPENKNDYDAVFILSNKNEDEKLISNWVGNEHLREIFLDEIAKENLLAEVKFFLGIPEPLEIERKFLIKKPSTELLSSLSNCKEVNISQCYLKDENKNNFRVRKRGVDGKFIYIRTEKRKISDIKRIEIEERIEKEKYESLIKGKKVLHKTRYCLMQNGKYFEIDVFPFWKKKALLEIELKNEDEEFSLPDFIEVREEVTFNPKYKNSYIAKKHAEIEK